MIFQVKPGKRYIRTCIIDEKEGIIGFQVVDIIDKVAKEKTAYVKSRINSIQKLLEYMMEEGYPQFMGPL